MATTYTHEDFTPAVVPRVFKKDVATLIATAVELGWTFLIKGDNNTALIAPAPNEDQIIHLSSRRNSGPLRRLHNKIVMYGKQPVTVGEPKVESKPAPVVVEPVTQPLVDWDAAAELNEPFTDPISVAKYGTEVTEKEVEALVDDAMKYIVSTGPMICKGGAGQPYESDIATQREWSDGTIDYLCVLCDYVGASPRSMASHRKSHTWRGEVKPIGNVTRDRRKNKAKPAKVRLIAEAIKEVLESGIDWTDMGAAAEQLAMAALQSAPQQPAVTVAVGNPPTTDAEILDAIRGLVGGDQSEKIAQLEKDVTRLQKVADAAEAEAAAAKQTLATFRDLFNDAV